MDGVTTGFRVYFFPVVRLSVFGTFVSFVVLIIFTVTVTFAVFLLARVTVITAVPSLEVAVILPFLSTVATDFLEDVQLLT